MRSSFAVAVVAFAVGCGGVKDPTPQVDAGEAPDAGEAADSGTVDSGTSTFSLTSLVISADDAGAWATYTLEERGAGPTTIETRARVVTGKATSSDKAVVLTPREPRSGLANGALVAAGASGEEHWTLQDRDGQAEVAYRHFLPGGAILSAVYRTELRTGRTTQNTSFGSMVRQGVLVAGPNGTAFAVLLAAQTDEEVLAVFSADAGLVDVKLRADGGSREGTIVALNVDVPVLASPEPGVDGGDGQVRVRTAGGQDFLSANRGMPAAFWASGADFRVAVKKQDSIAAVESAKTVVITPRSDETACTQLAFDGTGRAFMLHAGPKSAVLYVESGGSMSIPTVLSQGDFTVTGKRLCALAVQGTRVHAVYSASDIELEAVEHDPATGSNVLKTRHDTVKNSIGNIR